MATVESVAAFHDDYCCWYTGLWCQYGPYQDSPTVEHLIARVYYKGDYKRFVSVHPDAKPNPHHHRDGKFFNRVIASGFANVIVGTIPFSLKVEIARKARVLGISTFMSEDSQQAFRTTVQTVVAPHLINGVEPWKLLSFASPEDARIAKTTLLSIWERDIALFAAVIAAKSYDVLFTDPESDEKLLTPVDTEYKYPQPGLVSPAGVNHHGL